ncbi:MAG: C25 family cysteine peptidase [Candidatus Krumholzibacteriales bacterium]
MKHTMVMLFCLTALCLARCAFSEELSKQFYFDKPELRNGTGTGTYIHIPGCQRTAAPGKPALPVFQARFILPPGESVTGIRIEAGPDYNLAGRHYITPAPMQSPVSGSIPSLNFRDETVYSMTSPYPSERARPVTEQSICGIRIAFVNIYPCRLIPASGQVRYTRQVEVILDTGPSGVPVVHPQPAVERAAAWASRISSNPERAADYIEYGEDAEELLYQAYPDQSRYPFIIITSPALEDFFKPLAWIRTDSGLRARIVNTGWIQSNFGGADLQERIRSFIKYAYFNWQAEYVLLGGDDDIIPHRGLYVKAGSEIEEDLPADLYYAALDGNWNTDGDGYFGEPGEEDLLPEVSLGRLPVNGQAGIDNFTAKLSAYSLQPNPQDCAEAAFLGELLWSEDGVDTWGGDYKDETLYGSDNYEISTAGVNQEFASHILYDRETAGEWDAADLIPVINSGVNLVNHLGHTGLHNAMHLTSSNLNLLQNSGGSGTNPAVFYSQGCYAAAFDNRDYAGQIYQEDAIGEQLVTGEAGAVAFIGNSRYGWNAPGSTCGVSQFFDRQFIDAVFGEDITTLGPAVDDSRADNIPYISYPLVRYVMYGMTLLGDPAMRLWTGQPSRITAYHDSIINPGYNNIDVELHSGTVPVEGALISLYTRDYGIYRIKRSDQSGVARFYADVPDEGNIQIRVVSPAHFILADSILIDSSPDTLIELGNLIIDDDSLGGSSGDGDGIIERGETVQIGTIIKNMGSISADSCFVNLSCSDPYIAINDSVSGYFYLPEKTTLILEDEFRITLSAQTPASHPAELLFRINTPGASYPSGRVITVNAPEISLESWHASDSCCGNGNGCVEAWEFINFTTEWRNTGNAASSPFKLELSTADGRYCRVYRSGTDIPSIAAGETVSITGNFSLFVKPDTPEFTALPLIFSLKNDQWVALRETVTVTTCGYSLEDECDSVSFWNRRKIVGVSGWHISDRAAHSEPSSWKCGSSGSEAYPNMMDTALESPPLCLGENSSLSFWHRISAEAGTSYPYWAEDAGVVEISTDGGTTWTIVSPVSGYPCRASSANTIFLDPYQKCYSGESGWSFQEFDLSGFQGPVKLRFHFASNEQYGFDGWYVDDIRISTEIYTGADDRQVLPNRLFRAYPNPFNPATTISFQAAQRSRVRLRIFDVRGRLIKTLFDSVTGRGRYELTWNGENRRGQKVSSGVYLCTLQIGSYTSSQRLVLIR